MRRGAGIVRAVCLWFLCVFGSAAAEGLQPDAYREQLLLAMRKGDFRQAVISGVEAERIYGGSGRTRDQILVLSHLATAYESLGQYRKSLGDLQKARELAERAGDEEMQARIRGKLGNLYIFMNDLGKAEAHITEALELSRRVNHAELQASALNFRGNLYALQMKYDEALNSYREGASLAEKAGDQLLCARIMANAGKTLSRVGRDADAQNALEISSRKHRALASSHEKAYGLINIGQTYRQIGTLTLSPDLANPALKAFQDALSVAEETGDILAASYALGYLGQLEEHAGHYPEALGLTRRAILKAQEANAPAVLYLWQWQSGRLLKAEGRVDEAVSAYRNSVLTLQSIRNELLADCRIYNQVSFKQSVEPLYFGLADLLLRRSDSIQDQEEIQAYFREARQTIELLKTAELQDYFQDACVAATLSKTRSLDSISPQSAVVYVIPLPDRLELLLGLHRGIKRFTVRVSADTFSNEARLFRKRLEKRTTRQYLPHAQRLYEWIIRPLETELGTEKIDTLIFVPHGPLYAIPMSALHDGSSFLIEKYSVASTPGLNLTDPQHIQRERIKVLLAGLTESVQGFPALINVPLELSVLQELYTHTLLKDSDFRIPILKREMEKSPYAIVHFASHGEFFDDSRDTYILTWDGRLNMDELERFMSISKFRREPVSLLTLSACVTAAGDERAALGLAGVGIKAGARTAVATLWYINDHTSFELITDFYRQLQDASLSNAKALQQAQLKLLRDFHFRHPGYWSPFLLIGNWL